MGRLRIKKKETVIPFRETLAYRMIWLSLSVVVFIYTIYEVIVAYQVSNTLAFILAAIVSVGSAIFIFYNVDHLSTARVPAHTLKRMRRR